MVVASSSSSDFVVESGGLVASEGTSLLHDVRITNNNNDDENTTTDDVSSASGFLRSRSKGKALLLLSTMIVAAVIYLVSGGTAVISPSSGSATTAFASQQEQEWANAVDLEGSSKKKDKKKKHKDHEQDSEKASVCDDGGYSKRTLKKSYELPFASLFQDNKGQRKYEASSIIVVDEYAYAVCDNSWAISKFNRKLEPFLSENVQVGDPARESSEDSGYEALFADDGNFYVVRESVRRESDQTYHAIIEKISIEDNADDYDIVEICNCEFEFEGNSKGFEGAIGIRDLNNQLVVLGLCEGNYCSESRKNEKGNGKLVAMRQQTLPGDGPTLGCQWSTIRTIDIPSSAHFKDYSAITMQPHSGRVAISSQEESQLWIGQLTDGQESTSTDGQRLWDIDNLEFVSDKSDDSKNVIFDFPKNDNCQTIYCNVEGVHWLNDEMLIAVSDKMKGKGKQDFRCFDKDQSVHVFVLPS